MRHLGSLYGPATVEEGHLAMGPTSLPEGRSQCHGVAMTVRDAGTVLTREIAPAVKPRFSLRPIDSTDGAALLRFHRRLSSEAVRLRYFGAHPELQACEVAHLTCVDGFNRVAYVVENDGEIIAVGRYDRLVDRCSAEVAFVVADEFQDHGVGTMLLEQLTETARRVGIGEFKASVLVENSAMLAVFHGAGFPMTQTRTYDVVELTMEIGPRLL
jgi:GNAT superfamily N-acetyltransferase